VNGWRESIFKGFKAYSSVHSVRRLVGDGDKRGTKTGEEPSAADSGCVLVTGPEQGQERIWNRRGNRRDGAVDDRTKRAFCCIRCG
jgi:hypothetical protein